jgi:hypothetical protein
MKGKPLVRIALILLLLALVLWPVLKITRHTEQSSAHPVGAQAPQTTIDSSLSVTLLLHAAPSPINCSVTQGGIILLTETNLIAPGEYRAAVHIKKGDDLLITAQWKDGDPHALRAEVLVHGYQAPLEKSFWAQQSLEDTLPIPDSFQP